MAKPIYVLNGPNLNMLGLREPDKYGKATLADVERLCRDAGKRVGLGITFRQSNHEGDLVDWIQEARSKAIGIVINPAAYSHTSIALLDALLVAELPTIEVHITNIHKREEFRHRTYTSRAATGVIAGLGVQGYVRAIERMAGLVGTMKAKTKAKKKR